MDIDAWRTEATGVFFDDGLAFRTDLEGADCQMRKLQASLDRNASCTETNIPEDMTIGEIESLKCQQTNRHFGDHFLTTIEEGKGGIGKAERRADPPPALPVREGAITFKD